MKKLLFIFAMTLCATTMSAQTFIDKLRTNQDGQGKVTINQSAIIDSLVRQNPVEVKKEAPQNADATVENLQTGDNPATANPEVANGQAGKPAVAARKPAAGKPAVKPTKAYRIQVFVGNGPDKRTEQTQCNAAAARMRSVLPGAPVYTHFYTPHWKCRVGNFLDIEEARAALKKVKAAGYSSACIVSGPIGK